MQYVNCPKCHFNTPADKRICNICGLKWKPQPVADTLVTPAKMAPSGQKPEGSKRTDDNQAPESQPNSVLSWLADLFRGDAPQADPPSH